MKKIVTMITAAVLLSTAVFANDGNKVSNRVRLAFQNDFATATQVNWEVKNNFYFAEFKVGNTTFSAAYDEDAVLVASSRTIQLQLLPMAVTQELQRRYAGYTIARNITELVFQNETNYYITAGNEKQVLYLKASANGIIEVERKVKRKY